MFPCTSIELQPSDRITVTISWPIFSRFNFSEKNLLCSRSSQIPFSLNPMSFLGAILLVRKALPRFFLCRFFLTCLKKRVFSKRDLLGWKVPARLYWDLLTSGRYQPPYHYFSALRRKRTLYRPFHDFSTLYRPWAQISNHGRAVLRPFSYTFFLFFFNEKAFEQEREKEQ